MHYIRPIGRAKPLRYPPESSHHKPLMYCTDNLSLGRRLTRRYTGVQRKQEDLPTMNTDSKLWRIITGESSHGSRTELSHLRATAQIAQRHANGDFPRHVRSLNEPHHD